MYNHSRRKTLAFSYGYGYNKSQIFKFASELENLTFYFNADCKFVKTAFCFRVLHELLKLYLLSIHSRTLECRFLLACRYCAQLVSSVNRIVVAHNVKP